MKKVLFLCRDNASAGPMAESFLNRYGHGQFSAESVGTAPKPIDPVVVQAMRELDLDVSWHKPKSVAEIPPTGDYDYVIELDSSGVRVKDLSTSSVQKRIRWQLHEESPKNEDRLEMIRRLRDTLRLRTKQFVRSFDIVVDES